MGLNRRSLTVDIQIKLSNRSIIYIYIVGEGDYPILTPNSLILGHDANSPDAAPHESESETMKKRHQYIKRYKDTLRKR